MDLQRGLVRAYNPTNHTADVLLPGSLSRQVMNLPVAHQVDPGSITKGTTCAVAFFADGSHGLLVSTLDGPLPAIDLTGWGPPLTLEQLHRGWKDDFLGDALADQYSPEASGSTITLQDAAHGGTVRIATGTTFNNFGNLWLGNNTYGYDTLDADDGWAQIISMQVTPATSQSGMFGAQGPAGAANPNIFCGMHTDYHATHWMIRCTTSAGATTTIDSGIAFDANVHTHAIWAGLVDGTRTVYYWLDGDLIATCNTNVPPETCTPLFTCQTKAAAAKNLWVDRWWVIPL